MSPVASLARIQLDQLYLPFLRVLLDVIATCSGLGATYRASLGYRTFDEQDRLYEQGRTNSGPIVTAARGGQSPHNFGLACDFMRVLPSGVGSWVGSDYDVLGEQAQKAGLVWGGSWAHPDRDHVQMAGYVTAEDLFPLKAVYLTSPQAPLSAVFSYLDNKGAQSCTSTLQQS